VVSANVQVYAPNMVRLPAQQCPPVVLYDCSGLEQPAQPVHQSAQSRLLPSWSNRTRVPWGWWFHRIQCAQFHRVYTSAIEDAGKGEQASFFRLSDELLRRYGQPRYMTFEPMLKLTCLYVPYTNRLIVPFVLGMGASCFSVT
jgi:hypothetical protein